MMNTNYLLRICFVLVALFTLNSIKAQEDSDLLNSLDKDVSQSINYANYTFKSTHIINGNSVVVMHKHQLDFRINHRFGQLNDGLYNFYGLDNASMSLSFDYGITDRLQVGIRRSTANKTVDGSVKVLAFRQCTGSRNMPVTVTYYTDESVITANLPGYSQMKDRMAFVQQLLIARKFSERLSVQLSPTFVHRNLVNYNDVNNVYAVGIGGRYKFVRRVAFTWEYFYSPQVASGKTAGSFNPIGLGIDVETGGHVFQLFVTNSQEMVEKSVIAETQGDFKKGGIYFGFNLSRVFALGKDKQAEE